MKTFDEAVKSLMIDNKERYKEDMMSADGKAVLQNEEIMTSLRQLASLTMLQTCLGVNPEKAIVLNAIGVLHLGILIGKEMYQEDLERMMK